MKNIEDMVMTSLNENYVGACGDTVLYEAESRCSLCTRQCVSRDVGLKLRGAGLRCTRQRIELGRLLFTKGDRHLTADLLYEEAKCGPVPVSLATVYNTLQLFTNAGLVRRLPTGGPKAWFDTNVSQHHHLFLDDDDQIIDIPEGYLTVKDLPPIPNDMEIVRVDIIVQLRRR
jgi:Fur family transcriptional regulator, iron response regulator